MADTTTPFSTFREAIRFFLGDNDPDVPDYDSDQIDAGLRTIIKLGKVVNATTGEAYTVGDDGESVSPAIEESNTASYAQLVYYTAKVFADALDASSFSTRAFSERVAGGERRAAEILDEVYKLDHGDQCSL